MFLFCGDKTQFDLTDEGKRGLERGVEDKGYYGNLMACLILTYESLT